MSPHRRSSSELSGTEDRGDERGFPAAGPLFRASRQGPSRSALASLKRMQPGTNDSWDDRVLSKRGGLRDQEIASNPTKTNLLLRADLASLEQYLHGPPRERNTRQASSSSISDPHSAGRKPWGNAMPNLELYADYDRFHRHRMSNRGCHPGVKRALK